MFRSVVYSSVSVSKEIIWKNYMKNCNHCSMAMRLSIGKNLQSFTGNMSEKFLSGTTNLKQTNKQKPTPLHDDLASVVQLHQKAHCKYMVFSWLSYSSLSSCVWKCLAEKVKHFLWNHDRATKFIIALSMSRATVRWRWRNGYDVMVRNCDGDDTIVQCHNGDGATTRLR